MSKILTVRLTDSEIEKLEFLRQGKPISEVIRDLILKAGRTEERETSGLVEKIKTIYNQVDFLTVQVHKLDQILDALIQILEVLQSRSGTGTEDTKTVANILYVLSQIHDKRGWNSMSEQQRKWIVDTIKN